MKRIDSAFVVCVSILTATGVFAQQDFSKVEIKTTKLAGNFYTLEGQGGAIGVLAGPDGVLHGRQPVRAADRARSSPRSSRSIRRRSGSSSTRTCTAITPAATRTSARWA